MFIAPLCCCCRIKIRMISQQKKIRLAEGSLLLCGIIWGSGFIVMKNSLDMLSINWLLAFRFTLAALLLCAVLYKKLRHANTHTLLAGLACGGIMYAAYYVQTLGLQTTTVGNNAFLTAAYVVLVPFINWMVSKRKPGAASVLAGALCLIGVGVIALTATLTVNIGDLWTLLCGLLYALHIVCVSVFTSQGVDVMLLTALQFAGSAICAGFAAALFEPAPQAAILLAPGMLFSLLYLGLACTLLALLLQNIGLRYAPPAHASLLMSTEAVFGFLFGIIFLHEPFTLRFLLGATLIACSIVLSELSKKPASEETAAVTTDDS